MRPPPPLSKIVFENWKVWSVLFDDALNDMIKISQNKNARFFLENWFDALKWIFWVQGNLKGGKLEDYYCCVYNESTYNPEKKRKIEEWKIGFWCFNPGVCFWELKELKFRSIILTSGTLTPLSSFADEL